MPKSKPRAFLSPEARIDLKRMPGNIRRRMIVEIDHLEENPRPARSKRLVLDDDNREVRRLRLDNWRVVYLVGEDGLIVLAIRRRPPYDYEDLKSLIAMVR